VARLAKDKGVFINTIYCHWGHPQEEGGWKEFAADAGGKYAVIHHNERVLQIETPFDKELLTLNTKLNDTFVAYGRGGDAKKENYVAAELKQTASATGKQVDTALRGMIREQAAKKGVEIPK